MIRKHSAVGEVRQVTVPFQVRAEGDGSSMSDLTLAGYASVFNVVIPSYGEMMMPGCFTRTLASRGDRVKVLWQHDPSKPIGLPTVLREDAYGLYFEAQLADTPTIRNEYMPLMLNQTDGRAVVDRTSIGFTIMQDAIDPQTGLWNIIDAELFEFSPVTFPANEQAVISDSHAAAAMTQAKRALGLDRDRQLSADDAKYGMAILMGARGAGSFADITPDDRRSLYDTLARTYRADGLTPPPFADGPVMYASAEFAHDETTIYAARSLRKRLSDVTSAAVHAARLGISLDSEVMQEATAALDAIRAMGLDDVSSQIDLLVRSRAAADLLDITLAS